MSGWTWHGFVILQILTLTHIKTSCQFSLRKQISNRSNLIWFTLISTSAYYKSHRFSFKQGIQGLCQESQRKAWSRSGEPLAFQISMFGKCDLVWHKITNFFSTYTWHLHLQIETKFPKQRPGSLHCGYYVCAFISNTKGYRRHPELVSLNLLVGCSMKT